MSSHPGLSAVTLNTSGAGVCTISHNKTGFVWQIRQMAIASNPAAPMDIVTAFNGQPLMSTITVPSGAAAHGEPPISIGDHDQITVTVTNGQPQSTVTLSYYYEELQGM